MSATPTDALVLEGDLTLQCEDHYVSSGDIYVNGNLLVEAIHSRLFADEEWSYKDMGRLGGDGKVFGRVRVTVERLA